MNTKQESGGNRPTKSGSNSNNKSNNNRNRNKNKNKKGFRPKKKKAPNSSNDKKSAGSKELHYAEYKAQAPKIYKFITFDSFNQAKEEKEKITELLDQCDRLNIVIKAEGNMDDPELVEISDKIQVYAGEAWTLIHSRRLEEKWYDTPH